MSMFLMSSNFLQRLCERDAFLKDIFPLIYIEIYDTRGVKQLRSAVPYREQKQKKEIKRVETKVNRRDRRCGI